MNLKRIFSGFKAGDPVIGTIHRYGLNSSDLEKWGIIRRTQDEAFNNSKHKRFSSHDNSFHETWYFTGNTTPQYDHSALDEFEEDRTED